MLEHEIQKAVVRHYRTMACYNDDYKYIYAVPNGGLRNPRVAKKLKAEGVLAGVSDLVIPIPKGKYHGAYIEIKTDKGRVQPSQADFLLAMTKRGYFTAITRGVRNTIDTIDNYINLEDE